MSEDDLKIAIDDARHRHLALVNLILFTDQKAMAVFRLYVTIGIAAAAAGIAGFFRDDHLLVFARWSLLASAVTLALGAYFCFKAMSRANINLPGRGAEFWQWALDDRVSLRDAVTAYLKELESRQTSNRALNERTAAELDRAVKMGISTPAVAVVVGLLALLPQAIGFSEDLAHSFGYPSQLEVAAAHHPCPDPALCPSLPLDASSQAKCNPSEQKSAGESIAR
jgi:hypothetical protein